MNWSDSRKSYKSPEETQAIQGFSSLEPSTPTQKGKNHTFNTGDKKDSAKALPRQCPYHFNNPTHICLTCRKSICLRCAITYCQQHNIHTHDEIMSILKKDLLSFHV